jgi:hypothetical protein
MPIGNGPSKAGLNRKCVDIDFILSESENDFIHFKQVASMAIIGTQSYLK